MLKKKERERKNINTFYEFAFLTQGIIMHGYYLYLLLCGNLLLLLMMKNELWKIVKKLESHSLCKGEVSERGMEGEKLIKKLERYFYVTLTLEVCVFRTKKNFNSFLRRKLIAVEYL